MKHGLSVSVAPPRAPLKLSLALHSVSHALKAMLNTLSEQESAREIASVALSAEQERHIECVSHFLKYVISVFTPKIRSNLGPSVPARIFCSFLVPSANAVQCS